jgi:hypothetical protein
MVYPVELTSFAERDYDALYTRAQSFLNRGQSKHPSVLAFNDVTQAMDEVLPFDPHQPDRALAGTMSFIYCLPLNSVALSYLVNEIKPAVVVLTICEDAKNSTVRRQLTTEIERGEMNKLLRSLGIQPILTRIQVNDGVVM